MCRRVSLLIIEVHKGVSMLKVILDKKNALAILELNEALSEDDFNHAAQIIDPFIKEHGMLNGIVIYTKSFPGWKNFAALSRHIRFIKKHHRKIKRLAFATDTSVIALTEVVARPFIAAEIKLFDYNAFEKAKKWVIEG